MAAMLYSAQTPLDTLALKTSLIALNKAISAFTANIPPLTAPSHLAPSLQHTPTFAYSTRTAQQGFVAVARITCAAYTARIKMHEAEELLQAQSSEHVQSFYAELGVEYDSRTRRLSAARAIATIAHQEATELLWPDGLKHPKETFCLVTAVSSITPCASVSSTKVC